jgi:HD-GYP domain-containing protein (c-di-GMP phosphodiesterase class II)
MTLYGAAHPQRARAGDSAFEALVSLERHTNAPAFSFLHDEVIFGDHAVRDLGAWDWAGRFASSGIQRIEFVGAPVREEFDDMLHEMVSRTTAGWHDPRHTQRAETREYRSIRFGALAIRGTSEGFLADELPVTPLPVSLEEEVECAAWMFQEIEQGRVLPAAEAEAVVSSLSVVMQGDSEIMLPLLQLKEFDEYTTTHALNVSVLAMALCEYLGLSGRDTRAIGVAALLRDVGMTRVPREVVTKAGPPTEAEWALIRQHPAAGAKIILASEPQLDLAAVVALEHHRLPNGAGYPSPHFARPPHYASLLVQVCDVYDALRTRRLHRGAWTSASALEYVEHRAGRVFEETIAMAFVAMVRRRETSESHRAPALGARDSATRQ